MFRKQTNDDEGQRILDLPPVKSDFIDTADGYLMVTPDLSRTARHLWLSTLIVNRWVGSRRSTLPGELCDGG